MKRCTTCGLHNDDENEKCARCEIALSKAPDTDETLMVAFSEAIRMPLEQLPKKIRESLNGAQIKVVKAEPEATS